VHPGGSLRNQEGGELPRAPDIQTGKNVIRHRVNELRVGPFDRDINEIDNVGLRGRGGEPLQPNAPGVLLVALDQLGPSDAKLVERKDDALRAVVFSRVKADDFIDGGAVLVMGKTPQR
jgi:hypothetical protein